MGFVAEPFELKAEDRKVLETWVRSPTASQAMALRARILLASADGEGARAMARRLETSMDTVCIWRRRYMEEGLAGLKSRPKSGRPRRMTAAQQRAIVEATMRAPKAATH